MITIIMTFLLATSSFASENCQREWPNEEIKTTCSFTANVKGKKVTIEAGIYKSLCGLYEGQTSLKECMVIRTCGLGTDNISSAILHNRPEHLKSLCLTKKPRKALRLSKSTYVEFSCAQNKVTMKFVSDKKTKTCPLPFQMP